MTKSLRLPEGFPICPDCGEQIIFNACGPSTEMSGESVAALRDIVVAAHRRIAKCRSGEQTDFALSDTPDQPTDQPIGPD